MNDTVYFISMKTKITLWYRKRSYKYTVVALPFLLYIVWKCLEIPTPSIQSSHARKLWDKKELENLYVVIEKVNPAVAWQPVTFHLIPMKSNVDVSKGQSTFWARAIHEMEIISIDVKHFSNDIYTASFKPTFPGLYHVEILLTYINNEQFKHFSRHVTSRMVNVSGSPFLLLVQEGAPPGNITRYCTQSESGTMRGRWVKCGSMKGIERCNALQLTKRYDFDEFHGFHWLPYSCQLRHYNDFEVKKCFARNGWQRIIFTGDSHSRFRTYHWVTRLYGECRNCGKNHVMTVFNHVPRIEWIFDARGTRWPATFPTLIQRPNEIYIHPKTRRSHFSYKFPNSTMKGDLYIMNFGHWLLREMTFDTFMERKIASFVNAVKLMNETVYSSAKQKRFLWVNNLSLKWQETKAVFDWTTTPAPSTIGYLNRMLDDAVKEAGIQLVDAFQISNPRLGAIHDATHYAKLFPDGLCGGSVENDVTNVILNALCNEV